MNSVFVYIETRDDGRETRNEVQDVSIQLLVKGREIADKLGVDLECVCIGYQTDNIVKELKKYDIDKIHLFDDKRLLPYTTLPHSSIIIKLFQQERPQICLFGATVIGRDLGPRVSSALKSGLTADCTSLEIDDDGLLLQIRPAFGGSIVATIINPDHRPQMATVREGVFGNLVAKRRETRDERRETRVLNHDVNEFVEDKDFVVQILERHVEEAKHNLKNSNIVIAGGYGVGSKEGFDLLFQLAHALHGEVGASRAAVDAGWVDHDRQIGQTGITIHPKVYIACGISGAVQHIAGMKNAGIIISINNDPNAPITKIADYTIIGKIETVIPELLKLI